MPHDLRELTPAQKRVLAFLAEIPQWVDLMTLDRIKLLEADDVLVIPSLVEAGLVQHGLVNKRFGIVRATERGIRLAYSTGLL